MGKGTEGNKVMPQEWISVSDRYPVPRQKVLVAYKSGVTIAEYRGYDVEKGKVKYYWCGQKGAKHSLSSVTHWMPLPLPPT